MSQDKLDSVVQMRYHAERAETEGEREACLARAATRMERYGITEEQVTAALESRKRNEIRKRRPVNMDDFMRDYFRQRRPEPQPTTGWNPLWATRPPTATAVAKAYGLDAKQWRAWLRRREVTDEFRKKVFSDQENLEGWIRAFNRRRQRRSF